MSSLMPPEDLLAGNADLTVLDVRWRLGRTDGRQRHEAGHIPGAVYVDLDRDLADAPGPGGRHPLPDPERFGEAMRRCGVRESVPVVVYDDFDGNAAGRAWWLLRFHGHPDVRLLDGGWAWWQRLGGAVETGSTSPPYGDFRPSPGHLPVIDATESARLAQAGVLVDARAPERFRGDTEPVDPVAGRIPGAVNVPTGRNLVEGGDRAGRFKSADALRQVYQAALAPGAQVGAYCGSGVSAALDVFALDLLGVRAALYAGSWSEWVTDPSRPVETG